MKFHIINYKVPRRMGGHYDALCGQSVDGHEGKSDMCDQVTCKSCIKIFNKQKVHL